MMTARLPVVEYGWTCNDVFMVSNDHKVNHQQPLAHTLHGSKAHKSPQADRSKTTPLLATTSSLDQLQGGSLRSPKANGS